MSVQPHLHHLGHRSKPDLSLSQNSLIGLLSPEISKLLIAWQAERGRKTVCPQDGATHSGLDPAPRLAHHQLLAVVDLLIDAATETHWKSPGTGPMTWTYALFFMHVVVPKCTLPHSYIQHHWKHSMLCAKNDLKTFRQVHWGCMTCQRLHEIDKHFCTLLRVLKRSRTTHCWSSHMMVRCYILTFFFFLYFWSIWARVTFHCIKDSPVFVFRSTVSSKFTFRYLLRQRRTKKKTKKFPHCAQMPACWTHAQPFTIS